MFLKKSRAALLRVVILAMVLMAGYNTLAQSRFSMSVDAAPVYELLRYKSTITDFEPTNISGFRAGTSLHFRLAPRWSVSSGLWLEWKRDKNVGFGSYSDLSIHQYKVPLLAHYQLPDKRLTPFFTGGLVLEKYIYSTYSNYKQTENITLMNFEVAPQLKYLLGAGGKYQFSEYLAAVVQPTFIYGARSGQRSYQMSLQTQLVFQF